ncbi:homoserine O-acetyltransferase MetA [Arsenicicoccus sp. oral taxon 190]|uniref:homoserine O-acetyltransferase MetA n=1 Tax=Arsenicicoccus sp. oral taxon 190 TaxID=1658671 RepID=UPI000679F24B|nr:homoserine O-succinyltransferase [Arsenicicoccus sp. oral taxon 190]AKT51612.1 homoserine O-succinyltransferase [Arsenicicoccus sp. oral taxon 190]
MPVNVPRALPARRTLESENVFVMSTERAGHQDIRPLRIAIVNLMPTKIVTETQLLRLLANSPLQVEITLVRMCSHESRNTSTEHLDTFYRTFEEIRDERYDGLVITGAPVEKLPFEAVDYWDELCAILDWSADHVYSTMHVCWGAQAGLYRHYGIGKVELPDKMFGVFEHRVLDPRARIVSGYDETFTAPHSRHTGTPLEEVRAHPQLQVLATSETAGLYLAQSRDGRQLFVTGHPEYEADTLALEYHRDASKGLPIAVPVGYFPDDDPTQPPRVTWRSHAFLLYANWLNYYVYQRTPYDLAEMRRAPRRADTYVI